VGVLVREVSVVEERRDGEAQAGGFEGGSRGKAVFRQFRAL